MIKPLLFFIFTSFVATQTFGQRQVDQLNKKRDAKLEKRNKINEIIRNEEEGVPAFAKHSLFSIKMHHDGYGIAYEKGWMKTPYKSTIFQFESCFKIAYKYK